MHPRDCPDWRYDQHPQRRTILPPRIAGVLRDLANGQLSTAAVPMDSRPVHYYIFRELTPAGFEYFAGHYRGEAFRCLRFSAVGIPSDPRVGVPPQQVNWLMNQLCTEVRIG